MVRARSLPSMSSWSHAATYQQFIRNICRLLEPQFTSARRGYAPDRVSHVVRDEQGAALVDRHADRPSVRLAFRTEESAQHLDGLAGGRAVAERYEHDVVAAARPAVPRAVLADVGAPAERQV